MVMYRDFATRKARGLGLVGKVWNNTNSTVSVIAEGEEKDIEHYILLLKKGSVLSRVDEVVVDKKNSTGEFNRFVISYE